MKADRTPSVDWDDDADIESGVVKDKGTEKGTRKARRQKSEKKQLVLRTQEMSQKFGTLRATGKLERLVS